MNRIFFIFLLLFSLNAFSQGDDVGEELNWKRRPPSIQMRVDTCFEALELQPSSSWGVYNGDASYGHLGIDDFKLVQQIIRNAFQEGRQEVVVLDNGAGNFQLCDFFARNLLEEGQIPEGMHIHLIGIRGERYEGKEVVTTGPCTVYKLGSFKIENLEEEFHRRDLNFQGKIDAVFSRWATRHFVDPLGTWIQLYHMVRPISGLMIMDWFYFLLEGEEMHSRMDAFLSSRQHLLQVLNSTGSPFLIHFQGDPWTKEVDRFVLQRINDKPLKLPLAYGDLESCNGQFFDIGSHAITRFKVLNPNFFENPFQKVSLNDTAHSLCGDVKLFKWFMSQRLFYPQITLRQLYFFDEDKEFVPFYSSEEQKKYKKDYRNQQAIMKQRKADEKERRKKFASSLKRDLRQYCVEAHNYQEAGSLEYSLYSALRRGNFGEAQGYIDEGANLNRLFYFNPIGRSLLHYAIVKTFSKGSVEFLLSNRASIRTASLDDALYFDLPDEEVLLLLDYGMPITDLQLALARSIGRGSFLLVNYFMERGGQLNRFFNCLPMSYVSVGNPRMWNYLIDLGAKGTFGEDLAKKQFFSVQ